MHGVLGLCNGSVVGARLLRMPHDAPLGSTFCRAFLPILSGLLCRWGCAGRHTWLQGLSARHHAPCLRHDAYACCISLHHAHAKTCGCMIVFVAVMHVVRVLCTSSDAAGAAS